MSITIREQLITLLIAVALFGVFMGTVVMPRARVLSGIRDESQHMREENARLVERSERISEVHRSVDQLRRELTDIRRCVPSDDHFASFENNLLKLGAANGMWDARTQPRVTDVTQSDDNSDGLTRKRRMQVAFNSRFSDFYSFLQRVESHDKLTRIEALKIRPAPPDVSEDAVHIELELSIFYGDLQGSDNGG